MNTLRGALPMQPNAQGEERDEVDMNGVALFKSRENSQTHLAYKNFAKFLISKLNCMQIREYNIDFGDLCPEPLEAFSKSCLFFLISNLQITCKSTKKGEGFDPDFIDAYHQVFELICEDRDTNSGEDSAVPRAAQRRTVCTERYLSKKRPREQLSQGHTNNNPGENLGQQRSERGQASMHYADAGGDSYVSREQLSQVHINNNRRDNMRQQPSEREQASMQELEGDDRHHSQNQRRNRELLSPSQANNKRVRRRHIEAEEEEESENEYQYW